MYKAITLGLRAFMVLLITGVSLLADTQPGRSIITKDHINQFQLSDSEWIVRFDAQASEADKDRILNAISFVQSSIHYPSPAVSIVKVTPGVSEAQLQQAFESEVLISYAARGLVYTDGTREFPLDRVFVQLKNSNQVSDLQQIATNSGAEFLGESFMSNLYELKLDKNSSLDPIAFSNQLNTTSTFDWAEPDMMRLLKKLSTNDPFLADQWSLNNTGGANQYNGIAGEDMDVISAWGVSTGSASIKVAILDEGVDLNHPDLAANMLAGYDAHGITAGDAENDDAHGTACAGIVASVGNNNLGTAGVAYDCKIIPIRIAYSDVNGYWVSTASGIGGAITWAWQTAGADVLSNSWGGGSPSTLISQPFTNAITLGRGGLGAPCLAAAGNSNGALIYPAAYSDVISVAAMSMCGERKSPTSCDNETWWGSCFGSNLDIAAPGVKIYATDISGFAGYSSGDYTATFNGTSSACPNAAGVMALILSANPALTSSQAQDIIESTCDKAGSYTYTNTSGFPNGTRCDDLGYGRVNAYAAVQAAGGSPACEIGGTATASNLTATTATVTVTDTVGNATSYSVEYGPSGFSLGTGMTATGTASINLSGLSATTAYDFYFFADCSGTISTSNVAGSFTTACGSISSFPFTEGFEAASTTLGCWTIEYVVGASNWTLATGSSGGSITTAYNGSTNVRFVSQSGSNNPVSKLISPILDLSGLTSPRMIFYYGQQEWFGDQNELKVYYRTSSSGAWTQLAHYTNNVSSWTMELMNLPNPSSTYQVAFEGINNYGRANVIDDVTIEESPTCPDPFALGSMSVTSSSAVVYWNGGSATEWQVEYGPSGFAQGAGSTMTALNDTASIGMLTDNSSYDFYVQASCGSAWVGPMSFTTLCLASSMPYAESFDAWPPSCWDIDNGARVPVQYGGDYMEGSFWAWNNVSAEALSQAISISVDAQVRFRWSHLYNSTYPDQLLLLVRVSGTSTWDTLSNLQGTSFSSPGAGSTTPSPDADFVLEIINLDPSYTGQTVEFRFDMNSGYGPDVFVDDFSVMAVPSCADPQALGAMNITSNSADVYWNGNGVSNFIVEYGSVGFMQGTGTSMNSANDTATISGLTDNTSYDYFVQADCGNNGLSAWSGPFSFSTLCVSASMPYTESFDAWPPSCWDIDGGAAVPVHYGNDYMEGSFWSWDDITGEALSQAIQISSDAEVSYRWSHLYNGTSYPNDQVLLLVREVGTSTWDTISNLIGPSFDSPGAGNTTPSADADFITETISLDPSYTGSTVEFRFDLVSDYGPDVFIDDFSVAEPSNPCAVAIDSINTVNANKGLYRAFFDSIPGDAYMLEYKAVDETTWRSKTINNANQAYQDFNITPSFGANVQVRLAYEMGGVWNYGCESIIEVPCKSQALSIVVQRSARCTADSVLVRAGYAGGYGAPSFLWSNGATTKRTYADQGEKLVVVVTDAAGCSVTDSITAASLDNTAIPENFSLSKDNATTFTGSWTAPALPTGASLIGYRMAYRLRGTQSYTNLPSTTGLSTTVDFTGSGLPAGNYEFVVFTRYNDGTSAVNSNFTCIEAKGYTGVGNKNDASTDASSSSIHAIYPNPTNGVVYVATEEGAEVSLLDISGRVITKAVANSSEVSFDMSNLAQGVYMIRIENNSETITEQVVKN